MNPEARVFFTLAFCALIAFLLHTPAWAATAKISGFAVTPSKVEAFVPQGLSASIDVRLIGVKPSGWRIVWSGASREGVNVTVTRVEGLSNGAVLELRIYAYRPGFYRYTLLIQLPSKATGPIRAVPVIAVPVTVIVPGVRLSIPLLHIDYVNRTARVCVGLVPYGLHRLNLTGYDTLLEVYVDGNPLFKRKLLVSSGTRLCFTLGPYKPASIHRLTVVAIADNVSRDGLTTYIAIGRLVASLTASIHAPRLSILLLGGIVRAEYNLELKTNTTKCIVAGIAGIQGYNVTIHGVAAGPLGRLHSHEYRGIVAKYSPPSLLIPYHVYPAYVYARAYCAGIERVIDASAYTQIIAVDLTPLLVYAGIVGAVYTALRIRRRRRRRGEEMEIGGGEG